MDDDKTRRNLVVYCAGVVLSQWLEIKLPSLVAKLVGGAPADAVPAWRLWVAVLAVLVYLTYRFVFSDDGLHARTALLREWSRQRRKRVRATVVRHVRLAAERGRDSPLFTPPIKEALDEQAALYKLKRDDKTVMHVTNSETTVRVSGPWQGSIKVEWFGTSIDGNRASAYMGPVLAYSLATWPRRAGILLRSLPGILFASKASVLVVVTSAVWAAAVGVVVIQLGSALAQ